MTRREKMLLGLAAVIAFAPFALAWTSGADFTGTDDQARQMTQTLAPGYRPWFESPFAPQSKVMETLLFALQGALGAGVLGYCIGRRKAGGRPKPEPR